MESLELVCLLTIDSTRYSLASQRVQCVVADKLFSRSNSDSRHARKPGVCVSNSSSSDCGCLVVVADCCFGAPRFGVSVKLGCFVSLTVFDSLKG